MFLIKSYLNVRKKVYLKISKLKYLDVNNLANYKLWITKQSVLLD